MAKLTRLAFVGPLKANRGLLSEWRLNIALLDKREL
jgi:hypothetical protein